MRDGFLTDSHRYVGMSEAFQTAHEKLKKDIYEKFKQSEQAALG